MQLDRLFVCVLPLACTPSSGDGPVASASDSSTGEGSSGSSGGDASSGADTTGAGTTDDIEAALAFYARWPGLWVGAVDSMTSVGDFPLMNMDVRPVDGHTLFSRVDLDAMNSLRFALVIEDHENTPTLVFRNGGYFLGILRDSRTVLESWDSDAERWRFCALDGGCDYIDAVFDFDGADSMAMHVDVRGKTHFDWPATRAELRELDGPFPVDTTPQPGDAPFPDVPQLDVRLSWTAPLAATADAWIILSTTNCGLTGGCTPSRTLRVSAAAGATSADLTLEQIHPGTYKANAILDRNGDLGSTLLPNAGDTVSIANTSVTVDATGTTEVSIALLVDI